jgi:Mpv17 / PMP22 family
MAGIFRAYDAALNRHPLITKTLTSLVLFGLGDVMAQKLEHSEKAKGEHASDPFEIDSARLMRQAAWACIFTPLAHQWYKSLDLMVKGSGTVVVVKKTLLDQTTWTPVINSIFLSSMGLLATGDVSEAVNAVTTKLWPTLKVNWVVWPGLSAINLGLVPQQYRLLFVNIASLFWSVYLSRVANSKPTTMTAGDIAAGAAGEPAGQPLK